jgi:DNA (cytosine-5)-methyltransferase 1
LLGILLILKYQTVVKMKHGSLFSGIGGFDLAAQWMGWENVFHCEKNEFGRKVLNHYWPESISYEDVTQTDFTIHAGAIDIITGGFPCQPYSTAGKRLGKEDDRHLWPEMLRAIREIKPGYVVGENVRGLLSWNGGMVFDEVQSDLEAEGYEVLPFLLPACAVNAPHRRDRIWFIANAASNRRQRQGAGNEIEEGLQQGPESVGELAGRLERLGVYGNATYSSIENDGRNIGGKESGQEPESGNGIVSDVATYAKGQQDNRRGQGGLYTELTGINAEGNATDASNEQLQGRKLNGSVRSKRSIEGESGQPSRSVSSEWENFPTQPPICGGDDGLPAELDGITVSKWRNESIKAYGNAIVPQVAYQIFKAIEETNFQIQ